VLEVQIRTERMNDEAELGVCAHWRYKGSESSDKLASTYEEKIAWLRQVLDWHEETGDVTDIAEQLRFDVAQDRVYTFTPEGDVVNLALGATPLDFAYHVHTEIGHRCRGAKVNGVIVPLTYQLQTGERVEILTGKDAMPRRDWLHSDMGYLRTSRAKAKVQHWFRSQAREDNVDAGRHLLEKECRRLTLTSLDYQLIARKLHFSSVEDMFASVGAGDTTSAQVLSLAKSLVSGNSEPALKLAKHTSSRHSRIVNVAGWGNLMTHIAGCCKPLPGDSIAGFVTKGRGVSIHRTDCARFQALQPDAGDRVIDVAWESAPGEHYLVDVAIEAYDRQGLLHDITALFANARLNVLSINTQTHKKDNTATMRLRVEVPDLSTLSKLLERIGRLKNVLGAKRLSS
jgi:GTP pyrophosphokinase